MRLAVPEARSECARWIGAQEPDTVADALAIAEVCFGALQREASVDTSAAVRAAVSAERASQAGVFQAEVARLRLEKDSSTSAINEKLRAALDELARRDASSKLELAEAQVHAQERLFSERATNEQRLRERDEAASTNLAWLRKQFDDLDKAAAEKERVIVECNAATARMVEEQKEFMRSSRRVATSPDSWESEDATSLLAAISDWRASKGRYPKAVADLKLARDRMEFVDRTPNCFAAAVAKVKAAQSRKRPRTDREQPSPE